MDTRKVAYCKFSLRCKGRKINFQTIAKDKSIRSELYFKRAPITSYLNSYRQIFFLPKWPKTY